MLTRALTVASTVLACLTAWPAPAEAAGAPSFTLTSDQRRRMYELLRTYDGSAKDPAARAAAVGELVALGPVAASQLYPKIDRELGAKLPAYRALYDRAATLAAAEKERDADAKQLASDLAALKALEAAPTKELAESSGWPAMLRLKALYSLDTATILASDEKLAGLRADILRLGAWADACRGPIAEALAAQGRDASALGPAATPFDTRLALGDACAATRAFTIAAKHRATLAANERAFDEVEGEVVVGIRDLNLMRMIMGYAPLAIDVKLCAAARGHSTDMRERGFFDHESPVAGKRAFTDRARLAGTSAGGENIYRGSPSALEANKGWFHSPGHFTNMFRPGYKRVGIGCAGDFWTQMLG